MLFLSYLWRKETAVLMTSAMAIFAASSVTMPNSSLSAENAANTPAAFLLRCRARAILYNYPAARWPGRVHAKRTTTLKC